MSAEPALVDWDAVVVGDILELGGEPWEVTAATKATAKRPRTITSVRRRDGHSHTGSPKPGKVKRLEAAPPAIPEVDPAELAGAMVQVHLGGTVMAEITEGDPFHRVPREILHPGALLAHLYVYHGVREWPEDESPRAQHDRLHQELGEKPSPGYQDHTHDLGEG